MTVSKLYRVFVTIAKGISAAVLLVLLLCAGLGAASITHPEKFVQRVAVEVPVPVTAPEPSVQELLRTVPEKYGINPLIVAAIAAQESGGRQDAVRFEPSHLPRAAKITRNADKQRMLASSLGIMQIMGWHSVDFGLTWADLLDPSTNVEVGCSILRKCLDRHNGKSKVEQLRGALQCYNGSAAYADAVMSKIGAQLIERDL